MPSNIIVRKEFNLIEVWISGFLSLDELRREGTKIREIALPLGKMKFMIDVREAVALARTWPIAIFSASSWETLSSFCEEIAVVAQEADKNYLRFLEVISRNGGVKVKIFTSLKEAYEWIKSSAKE